jgi:acyl-homoserine-lactone acylase
MAMVDIFWDTYRVPHVFAENAPDLFYAFGLAHMQNHANLVLRLYGQARGRAAEYWGQKYLHSDRWVQTMSIPERARQWYEAQSPSFRSYLNAFAAGINDYAEAHPDLIDDDVKAVIPVHAVDVLAHSQRLINFNFMLNVESVVNLVNTNRSLGSNAWAISPSRSASGHAMLLTNPHLPWSDMFRLFEAHLNAPGINAYGITLVGLPTLTMAFNDFLGWSHTVNAYRGWTLYELDIVAGGYRLDGETLPFDAVEKTLKIKQDDGSLSEQAFIVRNSVHGPIISAKDGKAFALRIAGLSRPGSLEQWWNMACASDMSEFEAALRDMQIPMFTVMYADRDGHIMHFFNGQVPIREEGNAEYWDGLIPGNVPGNIWNETHPYQDLPRVVDPSSGWLQNSNDPPWTTTFPAALNPDRYPSYMARRGPMSMRAQRSARIMIENEKISLEQMIQRKFSTVMELADRLLDDLLLAALQSSSPTVRRAAEVLKAWDRKADADSRGAVLFAFWRQAMDLDKLFETPWDERSPLTTPRGLGDPDGAIAALQAAAAKVEAIYGELDVKWADVFQVSANEVEQLTKIADESLGIFPELWYAPTKDNRFVAIGGDSYTAAIEFSDPTRAMVLTIYGNVTQPHLTGKGEQFDLFNRKQMRPAWRTRKEIMDNLASHDRCSYS